MSIELEDRLRDHVHRGRRHHGARRRPGGGGRATDATSPRRSRTMIGVSVAAALLIALVVVTSRHDHQAASPALKDRPYAIPTWMVPGYGFLGGTLVERAPLPGFADTPATISSLVFRGVRGQEITILSTTDSGVRPLQGSLQFVLDSGAVAQLIEARTRSSRTLAWVQPGGNRVSIRGDGITFDELLGIANGIWWVTPAMWHQLTAAYGFRTATDDVFHPAGGAAAETTTAMIGSIQSGFGLWVGPSGVELGLRPNAAACSTGWPFASPRDHRLWLRSFTAVDHFVVTLADGSQRTVAASMPPGLPGLRTAIIDVGPQPTDFFASLPRVECVGGTS